MRLFAALKLPVAMITEGAEATPAEAAADGVVPAPKPPTRTLTLAPTAVTLDLDADCLPVWNQLQQLPPDERERWRARLEIAAGSARPAKLDARNPLPDDHSPTDKTRRPKALDRV